MITYCTLTVFFEGPFWVGVYEREEGERYEACKITFGAEPRDCEVWDFLLHSWEDLVFSPPVDIREREERRRNPKRVQREIRDKLREPGVGTKAQQALNLQREQGRLERRARRPRAARGGKGAPVRAAQAKAKGQAPRALKMPRRRVMPGRLTPAGVQRAGPEEAGARPRVGGGGRLRALRKKRKNFCKTS